MLKFRCRDCLKLVRDKPIFGTLHLCLSAEEFAARGRAMMEAQRNAPRPAYHTPSRDHR
jgi:hypothetical protein